MTPGLPLSPARRPGVAWRLLETGARPGAWNMGCDEAVLAAVERGAAPATLRLYSWSPPAVSLGRHQPDPEEAAADRLAALGVDWVRRPTGGRAVWHGRPEAELTYSVAARIDEPALASGLHVAYRRIHQALAHGLALLGVAAVLAPAEPRARGGGHAPGVRTGAMIRPTARMACFAASVPSEITVAGSKLVGSAQRRGRAALLQHGSIPLAGDQRVLQEAWPGSLPATAATTVSAAAGRRIDFAEAARVIVTGFREVLGVELEPGELTAREHAAIEAPTTERAAHHGV